MDDMVGHKCDGISIPNTNFVDWVLSHRTPAMSHELHRRRIRSRQMEVAGINVMPGDTVAYVGRSVSAGDLANLAGLWTAVFIGKACNLHCEFCPQPPKPDLGSSDDDPSTINTAFGEDASQGDLPSRIVAAARSKRLSALALSGGEPLMYLDRIEWFLKSIKAKELSLYVYLYTNGVLLNRSVAERLARLGVSELRVDIAASRYSRRVIEKASTTREVIPRLILESPAEKGTVGKIRGIIGLVVDAGFDQINLCEMVINRYNYKYYSKEPFYVFDPSTNYQAEDSSSECDGASYQRIVPTWSRHEAYDVIDVCAEEQWPLTVQEVGQGAHCKYESALSGV